MRLLVVALVLQLVVGGIFVALATTDFSVFGGGDDAKDPRSSKASAAGPAVPRPRTNRFDETRALALAREQVDSYGARPAGSEELRRLGERLRPLLPGGRFEAVPGKPAGMRNIVGHIPGRRPAIVIGAHYDTAVPPGVPGYVGANDGAAGTAAVVEMARAMARQRRLKGARELRFVLFDGEELPPDTPEESFLTDALRGSRAYARAHDGQTAEMLLLDYIGNRGLRLPREASSNRALWSRLRAAANRVGVGVVFPPRGQETVYDDHTPFLRRGVPAVDLIDFSYPHAHRSTDTTDRLSSRSLDAVGETVVDYLRRR